MQVSSLYTGIPNHAVLTTLHSSILYFFTYFIRLYKTGLDYTVLYYLLFYTKILYDTMLQNRIVFSYAVQNCAA